MIIEDAGVKVFKATSLIWMKLRLVSDLFAGSGSTLERPTIVSWRRKPWMALIF